MGIFFGVLGTAIAVTFGVAESTNSSAALAQSQLSYELDYRSYCEDHPVTAKSLYKIQGELNLIHIVCSQYTSMP